VLVVNPVLLDPNPVKPAAIGLVGLYWFWLKGYGCFYCSGVLRLLNAEPFFEPMFKVKEVLGF
jgi:hypothetical protein